MLPFVHIAPGGDYSTDPDFFTAKQIIVFNTQEGTTFCSQLESRVFIRG